MANLNINPGSATTELRKVIAEVNKLKKSLAWVSTVKAGSFENLNNGLKKVQLNAQLTAHKFKYLESILKKQDVTINKLSADVTKLSLAQKKAATSSKVQGDQAKKNTGAFKGMNKSLVSMIGLFGVIAGIRIFVNMVAPAFNLIKTFDSLGFAMERITKNSIDLAASSIFLKQITQDYGVTLVSTTERWIKFLAAAKQSGVTLMDTQNIFGTMTKAAGVLGLKTDELRSIYLALEQMLSKGKVTTEELRRQLGERLPGAMGIMAASMGVTIAELDKMMKRGEVLSAEVLPGFADAVEIAFGLDTVTKIETLIAKQNRLTLAWQGFIQSIAEGDGVIKKVLGGFFDLIGGAIERLDWLLMSSNQKMAIEVGKMNKQLEIAMNQQSKSILNAKAKQGERYNQIVDRVRAYETNKLDATTDEQLKIVEDNYTKDMAALIAFTDAKNALNKEQAKAGLTSAKKTFDEDQALYDMQLEKVAELNKAKGKGSKAQAGSGAVMVRLAEKELKINELALIESKARFILFRKWAEDSMSATTPGGGDGRAKAMKNLREILDLEREIAINRLGIVAQSNENIIDNEETSWDKRVELARENMLILEEIADLQKQQDDLKVNTKTDRELEDLKKALDEGKVLITDYTEHVIKLGTERTQKLILNEQKYNAAIVKVQSKGVSEITKLNEDRYKEQIDKASWAIDKKIGLLKEELSAEGTSVKRRKEINLELKKLSVERVNVAIEEGIAILEVQATIAKAMGNDKAYADAMHGIDLLKGKLQELPELLNEITDLEKWDNTLEKIGKIMQAIGDVFEAFGDRRIEQMEAEIIKERERYDIAIDLAKGDVKQKEAIQKEKDAKIKKLEKAKLKEEQRQAKIRKAFALSDVAIQTALALIRAKASAALLGPAGIPYFLAEAAFIGILSALQTAAILAAPIPQYAKGGDIKKAHVGMINEAGSQEYVKRGNEILTTSTKNALINLKPGDTVYPNYDSMQKDTMMLSSILNGRLIEKQEFDMFFNGIEGAISRGWKKAKINNNIRITKSSNNAYGNSLGKWSN